MAITKLSSYEFSRDVTRATQASKGGPVFITVCGKPEYVLLSFEGYQRLTKQRRDIADALAMPGADEIEFETPPVRAEVKPADLS